MKNNENEEEWIEMTVECPDCTKGRVAHWKKAEQASIHGGITSL